MADFYPLLDRAIRGLPDNSPEARNALYERARDVLVAQLREMEPPLGEQEIASELAGLNEVIARIESEQAAGAAPAARPAEPPVPAPLAAPVIQPAAAAAAAPSPAPSGAPAPVLSPASSRAPAAAPPPPSPPPSGRAEAGAASQPQAPSPAAPGGGGGAPHAAGPKFSGPAAAGPSGSAPLSPGGSAGASAPPAPAGAEGSAAPRRAGASRRRNMLIGGVLAVALAGVAGVAYWANKVNGPGAPVGEAPPHADDAASGDQKFAQRVDGDQRRQEAQPGQAVEQAQRAILYEENPDSPQAPKVLAGSVRWRLDSENPGQNQPMENVVRADVSIPEAGLDLLMTLRKNTDAALPASHLMELTFRRTAEGEGRVIRDIGVPQFKAEENARGVPLAGLPVAVSSSVFLVGLSNLPNDVERNVGLMLDQPWIDLPIRYDNGRRAVIALEKGEDGKRVIKEAFDSWGDGKQHP